MVKDGSYLNLVEMLPGCFKKTEHTQELVDKATQSCYLMEDESHICSSGYIKKCMETFKRPSEVKAVELIKKG